MTDETPSLFTHLPKPLSDLELKDFLDFDFACVPHRFLEFEKIRIELQKTCKHENWTWDKWGRICPDCNILMLDWGN